MGVRQYLGFKVNENDMDSHFLHRLYKDIKAIKELLIEVTIIIGEPRSMEVPPSWPWRSAKAFPRDIKGVHQGKDPDVSKNSMAIPTHENEIKCQGIGSCSLCLNLECDGVF